MIEAYPLSWPAGWPRAARRLESRYQVSASVALQGILEELRRMGVDDSDMVISTNVPVRRDGLPRVSAREPEDPGVAVYWTRDGQPQVMACDHWASLRDNLRAVGLALSAMRALERSGASEVASRAFLGLQALPADAGKRAWWDVLGIDQERLGVFTLSELQRAHRRAMRDAHPDRSGGSHDLAVEVNLALEAGLKSLRDRGQQRITRGRR